jgi:hypothetical protein
VRLLPRNYPLLNQPSPEEILHSPGRRRKQQPQIRPEPEALSTTATLNTVLGAKMSPPASPPLICNEPLTKSTATTSSARHTLSSGGSKEVESKVKKVAAEPQHQQQQEQQQRAGRPPANQHSPHPSVMKNLMEPQQNAGKAALNEY